MMRINFGNVSPSFIIIGTQKGGTSSLYHYLKQHPSLIGAHPKELHFFDTLEATPVNSYLKKFPKKYFTNLMSFEATPRYMYYPGTAKKLFQFNPNLKFIILLRDPAKRAFSAWNMYRQMQEMTDVILKFEKSEKLNSRERLYSLFYKNKYPTFEEWVKTEISDSFDMEIIEPSIVRRGHYKEQIENYFKYFKRSSFLFIDFDIFKKDIVATLDKVSSFLNISSFGGKDLDLIPKNQIAYTSEMDKELYVMLTNYYSEKNRGLEELIEMKLNWMHLNNQ